MEVETDTMIKEVDTEEVVEIIRGFKGKIDKVTIKSEEEKKTLSDECKEISIQRPDQEWGYSENKVKDKLKEFMKWYDNYGGLPTKSGVDKKAKEIFGERLM